MLLNVLCSILLCGKEFQQQLATKGSHTDIDATYHHIPGSEIYSTYHRFKVFHVGRQ